MKKTLNIITVSLFLTACGGAKNEFLKTEPGRSLMACVSGGGSLDIENIDIDNLVKGVDVNLIKNNKNIKMQFAVDGKINQASLMGASMTGEDKLTKFILMLNLELMCGGELASKILPNDYNNLRMLNQMQGLFR